MLHVHIPDRRPAYPDRIAVTVPLGLRSLVQRAAAAESMSAASLIRAAIERAAADILARHCGMDRAAALAAVFDASEETATALHRLVVQAPASIVGLADRQIPKPAGAALRAHQVAVMLHARTGEDPAIGALADDITAVLCRVVPGYADAAGD